MIPYIDSFFLKVSTRLFSWLERNVLTSRWALRSMVVVLFTTSLYCAYSIRFYDDLFSSNTFIVLGVTFFILMLRRSVLVTLIEKNESLQHNLNKELDDCDKQRKTVLAGLLLLSVPSPLHLVTSWEKFVLVITFVILQGLMLYMIEYLGKDTMSQNRGSIAR